MNTHRRIGRAKLSAVAALTVAAVGTIALAEHPSLLHAAASAADTIAAVRSTRSTDPSVAKLADLSDAFATIAAKVKPSVVYITAREEAQPVAQRRQRGQRSPGKGNTVDPNQLPPELREMLRGMGGAPGEGR